MSFRNFERSVRDPALPFGRRFKALGHCVQRYHPLGFETTFAYLAEEVATTPLRRDPAALIQAVDALVASRELWLVTVAGYAAERAVAKRLGRRSPRSPEPDWTTHWHGDRRRAARFALAFHLRKPSRHAGTHPTLLRLAATVLDTGRVPSPVEAFPDHHQNRWVLRQIDNAAGMR